MQICDAPNASSPSSPGVAGARLSAPSLHPPPPRAVGPPLLSPQASGYSRDLFGIQDFPYKVPDPSGSGFTLS